MCFLLLNEFDCLCLSVKKEESSLLANFLTKPLPILQALFQSLLNIL